MLSAAQFSETVIKSCHFHQVGMAVGGEATDSKSKPNGAISMGYTNYVGKEMEEFFRQERPSRLFHSFYEVKVLRSVVTR